MRPAHARLTAVKFRFRLGFSRHHLAAPMTVAFTPGSIPPASEARPTRGAVPRISVKGLHHETHHRSARHERPAHHQRIRRRRRVTRTTGPRTTRKATASSFTRTPTRSRRRATPARVSSRRFRTRACRDRPGRASTSPASSASRRIKGPPASGGPTSLTTGLDQIGRLLRDHIGRRHRVRRNDRRHHRSIDHPQPLDPMHAHRSPDRPPPRVPSPSNTSPPDGTASPPSGG